MNRFQSFIKGFSNTLIAVITIAIGLVIAYFFLIALFYFAIAGIIVYLAYKIYAYLAGNPAPKTRRQSSTRRIHREHVIDV